MKLNQKILLGIILFIGLIILNSGNVFGATTDTTNITITGDYDYDKAAEVLTIVNKNRAENDLIELEMDPTLTEEAMQRAGEISLYFSHTRPNDKSWDSIISSVVYGGCFGENIAAGHTTAEEVMEGWMKSTGHRANILKEDKRSIGIGCVKVGNTWYWTQLFSTNYVYTTTELTTGVQKNRSQVVELHKKYLDIQANLSLSGENNLAIGETKEIGQISIRNMGWNLVKTNLPNSIVSFESSNSSIFTVSKTGTIKAIKEGTATLYIKIGNLSTPVKITVSKKISDCKIALSSTVMRYNGSEKSPSITITSGNKKLVRGKDYTLYYKNNKNIGTGAVVITGKGVYTGSVTKTFKIVIGKPEGLVASTQTDNSITLKWKKDSAVSGYDLFMSETRTGKYSKILTTTKNSEVSYQKTKLQPGKTYYFKIRSYKTINGKKVYGEYANILTAATKTKTPVISSLSAGSKKATIRWNRVSGATGYEVYMSTSKTGNYSRVSIITKSTTLSYTKTNLTSGKTYYFKVRTYKTVNGKKIYSSYSNVSQIKIK